MLSLLRIYGRRTCNTPTIESSTPREGKRERGKNIDRTQIRDSMSRSYRMKDLGESI